MKVLEYWRKHAGTKNPFSWETIINVLQSRPIGNIRLAEDIKQKYTSTKKQLVLYEILKDKQVLKFHLIFFCIFCILQVQK